MWFLGPNSIVLDALIYQTAPNVKRASKLKQRVSWLLHSFLFIDGRISLISTPYQNIRLNITWFSRDADCVDLHHVPVIKLNALCLNICYNFTQNSQSWFSQSNIRTFNMFVIQRSELTSDHSSRISPVRPCWICH